MTTPAAEHVAEKARTMTAYLVLKFPEPPAQNSASSTFNGLKEVGRIAAANANAAISRVAEKEGAGTYVAVPQSSWKPQKVTVEQTTVVKVGEPG